MSDKILWNQLRSGDSKALERIYRLYFKDLYSYGTKFTQDESTVEDCIQELFIEIWKNRSGLSETNNIKPYLFLSLKRKLFRVIGKIRKITDTEIKEKHFEAELAIDQILMKNESNIEQREKLNAAFKDLSDRQKEILYLRYYDEMDYDQIVVIMDMNYQSARNLLARAIKKLSQLLLLLLFLLIM